MSDQKILALKTWEPVAYRPDDDGPAITMELRRMKRHEVKPLRVAFHQALEEMQRGRDQTLSAPQKAAILANVFEKVPEADLGGLFANAVRNVGGLEMDGVEVTTGVQLLEAADDNLVFFVVLALHRLSNLSSAEAFRSASLSTSSPAEPTTRGSSSEGASSTGSEASPTPSTATAPPTSRVPSSVAEL